jgi:vitamin B12 transporter
MGSGRTPFAVTSLSLSLAAVWLLALISSTPAGAQPASAPAIAGVVVDDADAALAAARITIRNAEGRVVHASMSRADGTFASDRLEPGAYTVGVELPLFVAGIARVTVPAEGRAESLRVVLKAGGFSEDVVVTGRRVGSRIADTPQKIEVVDATDLERTIAADLTDVLKKNAGVDVIQYSGVLSGIGIRGFRPQFSGINKRSLLLVDGRPAGATNLGTVRLDGIERIEVLKGAASATYGSSAMGGVVNLITRESRGTLAGLARVGVGSFGTTDAAGRVGGGLGSRLDFDLGGTLFDQRDDYRMGNGVVRPATRYRTYDGSVRVAANVGAWRVQARAEGYHGRDIMTPGDLAAGLNAQGSKDLERSSRDVRLSGLMAGHALTATAYQADEAGHTTNATTTNPLDLPFLPYLSFENDARWTGVQVRDAWEWSSRGSLIVGVDYEDVTSESRSFARTGTRTAPFSADSGKRTAGVYAEHTLKLWAGRTVVGVGGRFDHITTETVDTPFKTNFRPSTSSFSVFHPSLGVKHAIAGELRAHASAGRAFIPAEALMLTGYTTTVVGGRTQISQGNPDLRPERSTSFDAGVEWTPRGTRIDVTAFRTVVKDRFISNVTISSPPPPDPIVLSVANGLDAHLSGVELEIDRRLGSRLGVSANVTHYINRKERLANGDEQDVLNVAARTIRIGLDVDAGPLSGRVSARYLGGRKDTDFSRAGFPIVDYDDVTVVDATLAWRLARNHAVTFAVSNLFDVYYYEKIGFPLPGASVKVSYRVGF